MLNLETLIEHPREIRNVPEALQFASDVCAAARDDIAPTSHQAQHAIEKLNLVALQLSILKAAIEAAEPQ